MLFHDLPRCASRSSLECEDVAHSVRCCNAASVSFGFARYEERILYSSHSVTSCEMFMLL